MTSFDPGPGWPRGGHRDLVLAAFHRDPATATAAWRRWEDNADIDAKPWTEVRMVPYLVHRLEQLGLQPRNAARFTGIRRFVWVSGRTIMAKAQPLVAALDSAGIPVMVTKGGAQLLLNPDRAGRRSIADLDILVAKSRLVEAFDTAEQAGWSLENPADRIAAIARLVSNRQSVALVGDGSVEVDLHTSALWLNRCPDHDDGMWARARRVNFGDTQVHIPSPADRLVMALGHGLLQISGQAIDWVGDAVELIAAEDLDWAVFVDEIGRRELFVYAHVGLQFLSRELDLPVPRSVLTRIAGGVRDPYIGEFLGNLQGVEAPTRKLRADWGQAAMGRARQWRKRARRNSAGDRKTTRGPKLATDWQTVTTKGKHGCVVPVPTALHEHAGSDGRCLLDLRIVPVNPRQPPRLSLALLCFGPHFAEIDCRDLDLLQRWTWSKWPGWRLSFKLEGALLAAYALPIIRLSFLIPGTFDGSPYAPLRIRYRWRRW